MDAKNIRIIAKEHLEVGMYISAQSSGVADASVREQGIIQRQSTLDKLKSRSNAIFYIDISKGKNSQKTRPVKPSPENLTPKKTADEEKGPATKIYKEATNLVGDLMRDVKLGKPIEVGPMEQLADEINSSIISNENALAALSQIREKDQYLLQHSINVGILMGIFARYLGYKKSELHEMVTGALIHDIGKIRVPNHILHKPGKLLADEWTEMQNHVIYGVEVLKKSAGITPIMMEITHTHHERLDGSGYPRNLSNSDISVYARMASIVDVYDAMTADRVYHQGKSPGEAIKFLLTLGDTHLDKPLLYEFIRCMGVYPVGSFVELSNGRAAVVIESDRTKPAEPKVRTFYNLRHKNYEPAKVIDLSHPNIELKIIGAIEHREYGFDPAELM